MLDPLSEPPSDFELALPVTTYPAAGWYRVHSTHYGALYFDRRPTYRFNAPRGDFGVLYMAEKREGA